MTVVDPRRAGRAARNKGARGENTVLALLRASGWPTAMRSFSSGATGGGDIVYGPDGFHWECKWVERLNLHQAFAQAQAAARPSETPVVVHKRSRDLILATLPFEDLLALMKLAEQAA